MNRERFAPLLSACRQLVSGHLMPLLSDLFDNAAPVLLELADKAESNQAQHRFFEAMRAMREHPPAVETAFSAEVERQFQELVPEGRLGRPAEGDPQEGDAPELALVEEDAFEEGLALQDVAARALVTYAREIYGLRQRLSLIVGGRKIEEEEIPGGPHQLAAAFHTAAAALPLEPKSKLIVLMLFDRFVMGRLADMYEEYNDRLIDAGLLPHLKSTIAAVPASGAATGTSKRKGEGAGDPLAHRHPSEHAVGAPCTNVAEETFDAILQLLSGHRGGHSSAGVPPQRTGTVATPVLISSIHRLQRSELMAGTCAAPQAGMVAPTAQLDSRFVEQISSTLTEQRKRLYAGVNREQVDDIDADVIDLVGLIFEYMLNEDALPNVVKALLSHLHTPFLKVALLDRQFFTKEGHPARQLLNAMIDAGARFVVDGDLKRGIYPYLQALVERIRSEFKDGLGLFEILLAELQGRVQQMTSIAEVTERRACEAASGQERLEQARRRAAEVIDASARDRPISPEALLLLRQSLSERLAFILLRDRDGEQGAVWHRALRLVDDIVATTSAPPSHSARSELRRRLPDLRVRMRADLDILAGFGAPDAGRLYEQIATSQEQALSAPIRQRSGDDVAKPAVGQAPVRTQAKVVTTTLVKPAMSPNEKRVMRQLDQADFGTWFDCSPSTGEPRQRVKLAWYTPVADRYMFVDAMGVQVAILSRKELARRMVSGEMRIRAGEMRPFLDRAMDAVRHLLGGEQRPWATASAG